MRDLHPLNRIPITFKFLFLTLLIGSLLWFGIDRQQSSRLHQLFLENIQAEMDNIAKEDRRLFDLNVQGVSDTAKLITFGLQLHQHLLEQPDKACNGGMEIFHANSPPAWLPPRSALRRIFKARYAILLDPASRICEIYHHNTDQGEAGEDLPAELLRPSPMLSRLSHSQAYMTIVSGRPFIVASQPVEMARGRFTLLTLSPIDDDFMERAVYLHQRISVLLMVDRDGKVFASSNRKLIADGDYLADHRQRYLSTPRTSFDYGASDLELQLISLVPTREAEHLSSVVMGLTQHQRTLMALGFTLAFALIGLWYTRRVKRLYRFVTLQAQKHLGIRLENRRPGDEISDLDRQLRHFTTELENRKAFQQAVLETIGDGLLVSDRQGSILLANPALASLFDYTMDELLGQPITRLLEEHDGEDEDALARSCLELDAQAGTGQSCIRRVRRRNGEPFVIELSVNRVREADRYQLVTTIRDVTERFEAQQRLLEAKRAAEQANQAKTEFLASMSHELRTPLNSIMGFAQLLDLEEHLSAEDHESAREIHRAGRHLLSLIEDVLDLAKIETGKIEFHPVRLPLGPMLRDCYNLNVHQAGKNEVRLQLQAPEEEIHLEADPTRLKQVILNLLSNAIKYNRAGGEVVLSARPLPHGRVEIAVRDTGPGIAADKQDKLFEPFNRLGYEGSVIEGTGIGLTISRQLVERMGGEIRVESTPGEGSRFWIELPVVETE